MPFYNKQSADNTSKPKTKLGDEPEDKRQQLSGDRRRQPRDGDRRQQPRDGDRPQQPCNDDRRQPQHAGEPREQNTHCNWDDKCAKQNCQKIHLSRGEGSVAPSKKPPRDNAENTDDEIRLLKEKLAVLEHTKKQIEDFKRQQRVALDQFVAEQAAELEAFMKSL